MSKEQRNLKKVDGVVDAAHFGPDGELLWLRAYERRGPTWSDVVLLDRQSLIQRLDSGKRFYSGSRHEFRASEFDLAERIHLRGKKGKRVLVIGTKSADQDQLGALPII